MSHEVENNCCIEREEQYSAVNASYDEKFEVPASNLMKYFLTLTVKAAVSLTFSPKAYNIISIMKLMAK